MNRITIKDIMNALNVSFSTAQRIYSDIKTEKNLKIVCFDHFKSYLKL